MLYSSHDSLRTTILPHAIPGSAAIQRAKKKADRGNTQTAQDDLHPDAENADTPICFFVGSSGGSRSGQTLFIDARKLGHLVDRTHRELTDEEISRISQTYHAWRGENEAGEYQDIPGFCIGTNIEKIASHSFVLTPGRYVGAEEIEADEEPFEEKMSILTSRLEEQFNNSAELEKAIRESLERLGVW